MDALAKKAEAQGTFEEVNDLIDSRDQKTKGGV